MAFCPVAFCPCGLLSGSPIARHLVHLIHPHFSDILRCVFFVIKLWWKLSSSQRLSNDTDLADDWSIYRDKLYCNTQMRLVMCDSGTVRLGTACTRWMTTDLRRCRWLLLPAATSSSLLEPTRRSSFTTSKPRNEFPNTKPRKFVVSAVQNYCLNVLTISWSINQSQSQCLCSRATSRLNGTVSILLERCRIRW